MTFRLHFHQLRCTVKIRSLATKQKRLSELLTVITNQQVNSDHQPAKNSTRPPASNSTTPETSPFPSHPTTLQKHSPQDTLPVHQHPPPKMDDGFGDDSTPDSSFTTAIIIFMIVFGCILVVSFFGPPLWSYISYLRLRWRIKSKTDSYILPTTKKCTPSHHATFDNIHRTPHVTSPSDETRVVEAAAITSPPPAYTRIRLPPPAYTRTQREPRNVFVEAERLRRNGSFNMAAMGGRRRCRAWRPAGMRPMGLPCRWGGRKGWQV